MAVPRRGSWTAAAKAFVSRRKVRVGLSDAGLHFLPDPSGDLLHVLSREFLLQAGGDLPHVQLLEDDPASACGGYQELRPLVDARGLADGSGEDHTAAWSTGTTSAMGVTNAILPLSPLDGTLP